ncbi:MAG: BON domain-containing protein [Blastocatellia bacterium]
MKFALQLFFVTVLAMGAAPIIAKAQQPGARLSDDMIETLVKHRLMRAGVWKANNIEVDVDDGVVELKGKALSHGARQRAERIALRVDDVMRVENKIEVETRFRNDQAIADEVASDIRGNVWFDIFDWVEGKVNNGVVTLTGAVREPWRKEEYANIAEDVLGVKSVNNQIEVLPNSIYDDRLRVGAARLIYNDPRFARYANRSNPPIHIVVDNGRITLEGAVNNQLEKQVIGSLVRSGTLAFGVQNNLKVDTRREES